MLFTTFPCAARDHLLWSQSSSPLHVLRVDEILFFGVHGCATVRAPLTLCEADVSHVSHVCDSSDSCSRCSVSLGVVPLGQRALLDQFRPSMIDRSAEPNGTFPMADPGVAPAGTRLTTPLCCLPHALSLSGPCEKGLIVILVGAHYRLISNFSPSVLPLSMFSMPEVSANCRCADDAQNHQIGDLSQRPWSPVSGRRDGRLGS